MLAFGSALSDYARAPEDTDYLRSALTEATAGTTTITGGLTLGSMIAVGTSANKLAAGMQAVDTDNLPMIWAGAAAASDAGITGAKFRVKADGHVDASDIEITSGSSSANVMIADGTVTSTNGSYKSVFSSGTMGNIASITSQKQDTKTYDLAEVGELIRTDDSPFETSSFQSKQVSKSGSYTFFSHTTSRQATLSIPAFTIKFTSDYGQYSTEVADDIRNQSHFDFSFSLKLIVGNSSRTLATAKTYASMNNARESSSVSVSSLSIVVPKNYAIKLVASSSLSGTIYPDQKREDRDGYEYWNNYKDVDIAPDSVFSLSSKLSVSVKVGQYCNTYYADGLFLQSETRYFAASSFDTTGVVLQAASATALLKFGTSGLLQSLDGGKQFYRANPLVLVVRLTYASSSLNKVAIYNPLGKTVSVTRTGTGQYTVTHNLGHTNYTVLGSGKQSENKYTLYVTVVTRNANTVEIRTSDDSSLNDLSEAELSFFDYKTY